MQIYTRVHETCIIRVTKFKSKMIKTINEAIQHHGDNQIFSLCNFDRDDI